MFFNSLICLDISAVAVITIFDFDTRLLEESIISLSSSKQAFG